MTLGIGNVQNIIADASTKAPQFGGITAEKDNANAALAGQKATDSTEVTSLLKTSFTNVATRTASLVEGFEDTMGTSDDSDDADKLEDIYTRMSDEDSEGISAEQTNVKEYLADQLECALERIKLDRAIDLQLETRMRERMAKSEAEIENMAESFHGMSGKEQIIAQKLKKADLPVNDAMIEDISRAADMLMGVMNISEQAKAYLVGGEREATISNIHKATVMQARMPVRSAESANQEIFDSLRQQTEKVIDSANYILEGTDITPATQDDAKWLFANNLPITDKSIVYKKQLESLEISEEVVIDAAIKGVSESRQAYDALLIENIVSRDLSIVTPDYVKGEIDKSVDILGDAGESFGTGIKAVTGRRKLEESLLVSMTEGRYRSSGLIGEHETSEAIANIEENIKGLKNIENEYYSRCFSEIGETADSEDVDKLSEIVFRFEQLAESPSYVLGATYEIRTEITVSRLADEGQRMKAALDRAQQTYDAVGTQVRTDLGDNIRKAFANVDELLELNGYEVTDANRRAARILGYNRMELSEENMNGIKNYDSKVNDLLMAMKPVVAAELVKQGVDPLMVPVDELTAMLKKMSSTLDANDERYSEYLVRLDRKGELTEDERDAYIGIFRLLQRISKDDGAVIGDCMNRGVELTLGNLLGADRTRRAGHVDAQIDDSFGGLTDIIQHGVSISDQILGCIKPQNMNYPDFLNMTEERFLDSLRENEGNISSEEVLSPAAEQLKEDVRMASSADAEMSFLNILGEDKSLGNILAMQQLMTEPLFFGKLLKGSALSEDEKREYVVSELPKDYEELGAEYDKVLEGASRLIEESLDTYVTSAGALALERGRLQISLLSSFAKKNSVEIPMEVDGEVVQMNLTLISGDERKGHVSVRVRSEHPVTIQMAVSEESVEGLVCCDSREHEQQLKAAIEAIRDTLQSENYEEVTIYYAQNNISERKYIESIGRELSRSTGEQKISNQKLYDVAKLAAESVVRAMNTLS